MKTQGEWIDVVDEQGNVLDIVLREEVHRNPALFHRAVHAIVVNEAGHIFLQKRAKNKDIEPGKWDCSVGGHLESGEDYNDAVKREAEEELGIRNAKFEKIYAYTWRSSRETELVRTYLCRYSGPFSMNMHEIEAGKFWLIDEIQAKLGSGTLTPNFEEEFKRFLAWKSTAGVKK